MSVRLRNTFTALLCTSALCAVTIGEPSAAASKSTTKPPVKPPTKVRATGTKSIFVSLDTDRCKQILAPESDEDFQDYGSWLCPPSVAGWSVILDYGDLRDSITLRKGGVDYPLNFAQTVSGRFASAGPRFEFRIRGGQPIGTIVRFEYDTDEYEADGQTPMKNSVLVVSRMRPTPCVIGVIDPGPTQNATAQTLADASGNQPCRTETVDS